MIFHNRQCFKLTQEWMSSLHMQMHENSFLMCWHIPSAGTKLFSYIRVCKLDIYCLVQKKLSSRVAKNLPNFAEIFFVWFWPLGGQLLWWGHRSVANFTFCKALLVSSAGNWKNENRPEQHRKEALGAKLRELLRDANWKGQMAFNMSYFHENI